RLVADAARLHRHDRGGTISGHGCRQRGDRVTIRLRPEIEKVLAFDLAAVGGADTGSGKADREALAVNHLEDECVGEDAADVARLDLVPARRRRATAHPIPIAEKLSRRSVFHISPPRSNVVLTARSRGALIRSNRAGSGQIPHPIPSAHIVAADDMPHADTGKIPPQVLPSYSKVNRHLSLLMKVRGVSLPSMICVPKSDAGTPVARKVWCDRHDMRNGRLYLSTRSILAFPD